MDKMLLSGIMLFISFISSLVYGIILLQYLNVPNYLWAAWGVSSVFSIVSVGLSLWSRDEFYEQQFRDRLEKAGVMI